MCFVVNLNDISVLIEEGGGIFVSGSDGLMNQFAGLRIDRDPVSCDESSDKERSLVGIDHVLAHAVLPNLTSLCELSMGTFSFLCELSMGTFSLLCELFACPGKAP